MNRSESKYFNTAIRMDEALIKLMETQEFSYISVKAICETAGVNCSTFWNILSRVPGQTLKKLEMLPRMNFFL